MPPIRDARGRFTKASPPVNPQMHTVLDAFQNLMARTGYGSANLMEGTNYVNYRLTRQYQLLNTLYRSNWLARRVIDLIPKYMLKSGWKYDCDIAPEDIDRIYKAERQTKLSRSIQKGLNWGRLYGGAAGLMLIDGQEDQLEEPLDIESVLPGDFKGLLIVDRWSGVYPHLDLITDISNPEFGLPEYYEFRPSAQRLIDSASTTRVHHSRIVRFEGWDLPDWERQAETYWGVSVIESVFEELKKRDNASANIAGLLFLANLRVMLMESLGELLASGTEMQKRDLYNTISAQNELMNNFGILMMSKEDDFKQFSIQNFRGLQDVYREFKSDMAGAAQIPMRILFGDSEGQGLGDSGDTDMRVFYDVIEGEQEAHLLPILEKLMPVISMSTLGQVPDDMEIVFNPLWTPGEKEIAEIVKAKGEVIMLPHNAGIISDQIALKEFKQMAEGTGLFSNITDEDIDKADAEVHDPMEGMLLEGDDPKSKSSEN